MNQIFLSFVVLVTQTFKHAFLIGLRTDKGYLKTICVIWFLFDDTKLFEHRIEMEKNDLK